MKTTVYRTTLTLTIIEPGDYLNTGTEETEFDDVFPTEEIAIKKAEELFEHFHTNSYVKNVWAAVWPIVIDENGSTRGERIFNLYK